MIPVNLIQKFTQITEHWRPKIAGEFNGQEIRLVKIAGVFPWHRHETDEVFLVWRGKMRVEFREQGVELGEGEMFIVPGTVEHRTSADAEAEVIVIDPAGTRNTGDVLDAEFTAPIGVRV